MFLLLLRPSWALGADHLQLGSGEGVLNGQGLTVHCGFRGLGKRGVNSFKYFRQPLRSFVFWSQIFLCGPFSESSLNLLQYCFHFLF